MTPFTTDFILGEKKYVWFKVTSKIEQKVVITSATWQLTDGEQILDNGVCTIEENIIKILLEPASKGVFMLQVQYEIPPEIKKTGVSVVVH